MIVRDTLRSAGLRRTPAREQVLGTIDALRKPVTHGELAAAIGGLDEITLYRTLTTFVEAGLVHRVQGLDGAWRYCAQPEGREGCPGNHAHFLCTDCRSMTCLVDAPMPRVEVPPGAEVHGRHFLVYGRCVTCA
jgi:Fur family ferric uptake transcriptional regulator